MRPNTAIKEPQTPTVQDTDSPDEMIVTFGSPVKPKPAKLVIRQMVGSGAQGEVLAADLIMPDQTPYRCVVKRVTHCDSNKTPIEFRTHQKLTQGLSSATSGLLSIMGIHTVTDERGNAHKYAVMPECTEILSSRLPKIRALGENPQSKSIFQHQVMSIFRSLYYGLENLFNHQMAHLDLKPENIGLHHGTWCMLDFGLAQSFDDFCNNSGAPLGTPYYIPPENFNNEYGYPFARDVWAIGQIFLQMMGKKCSYQCDINGTTLSHHMHLFKKGNGYKEKRRQEQEKTKNLGDTGNSFNTQQYQSELQRIILSKTDFEDCLNEIVNAMCHLFPEGRPTLETLQKTCQHLEHLLPLLLDDSQTKTETEFDDLSEVSPKKSPKGRFFLPTPQSKTSAQCSSLSDALPYGLF